MGLKLHISFHLINFPVHNFLYQGLLIIFLWSKPRASFPICCLSFSEIIFQKKVIDNVVVLNIVFGDDVGYTGIKGSVKKIQQETFPSVGFDQNSLEVGVQGDLCLLHVYFFHTRGTPHLLITSSSWCDFCWNHWKRIIYKKNNTCNLFIKSHIGVNDRHQNLLCSDYGVLFCQNYGQLSFVWLYLKVANDINVKAPLYCFILICHASSLLWKTKAIPLSQYIKRKLWLG